MSLQTGNKHVTDSTSRSQRQVHIQKIPLLGLSCFVLELVAANTPALAYTLNSTTISQDIDLVLLLP